MYHHQSPSPPHKNNNNTERSSILKRAIREHTPRRSPHHHHSQDNNSSHSDLSDINGLTPQLGETNFTNIYSTTSSSSDAHHHHHSLRHSTGRGAYIPMYQQQQQQHPGSYIETLQEQRERNREQSGRCNLTLNFESRRRQLHARKEAMHKLGVLRNEKLIQEAKEEMKRLLPALNNNNNNNKHNDTLAGDPKIETASGLLLLPTSPKDANVESFFADSTIDEGNKNHSSTNVDAAEDKKEDNNNDDVDGKEQNEPKEQEKEKAAPADDHEEKTLTTTTTKKPPRSNHHFHPPSSRQLIDLSHPPPTSTTTTTTRSSSSSPRSPNSLSSSRAKKQKLLLEKAHEEKALRVANHQMEALRASVTRSASRTTLLKDGLSRLRGISGQNGGSSVVVKNGLVVEPAIVSIVEYERHVETPRRQLKLAAQRKKPLNIVEGNGDEVDGVIAELMKNEAFSRKERDRLLREERDRRAEEALKKRLALQKAKMEAEREEEEGLLM